MYSTTCKLHITVLDDIEFGNKKKDQMILKRNTEINYFGPDLHPPIVIFTEINYITNSIKKTEAYFLDNYYFHQWIWTEIIYNSHICCLTRNPWPWNKHVHSQLQTLSINFTTIIESKILKLYPQCSLITQYI